MPTKSILLPAAFAFACLAITSCDSATEDGVERDLDRLGSYLDSVKTATPVYTAETWDKIKTEYNHTIDEIQAGSQKVSESANKKLEKVKEEYNKLKDDYTVHVKEAEEKKAVESIGTAKLELRKSFFGDAEIGSDMKFGFVTAKNALPVYEKFVNTVKDNQNKYSREDWDEIKLLYEALDTRKNEIEKELSTNDNLKIAKKKVEFAAIKSVKRPLSKVDENTDAKK
ncbi:MAG: hypothetical protein EOO02_00985 [Chitinophagaceae bacterium]|nr:MAG: hypothetical protein EOO02_00985 [Chitinophagaceae bacterium]